MFTRYSRFTFALFLLSFVACQMLAVSSNACAVCILTGTSTAVPNPDDPGLGAWKYCIEIDWITGSQYALSHANVILLLESCACVCDDFPFGSADTAGISSGVIHESGSCTVYYYAEFNCYGDPSIPGLDVPIVKFEPYEDECEPGPMGSGTFCFYTDWPPEQIVDSDSLLALKAGQTFCYGDLTGMLPSCQCDVPIETAQWGVVKALFE